MSGFGRNDGVVGAGRKRKSNDNDKNNDNGNGNDKNNDNGNGNDKNNGKSDGKNNGKSKSDRWMGRELHSHLSDDEAVAKMGHLFSRLVEGGKTKTKDGPGTVFRLEG